MPESNIKVSAPTNSLLESFAYEQLALIKRQPIRESSFLEIIFCAFIYGAEQQLCKQSDIDVKQSQQDLIHLIKKICRVGDIKAQGLIESVARLADKYYLIENIIEQGQGAADQWLNCDTVANQQLKDLIDKYRDATMFDLGIDGINPKHESQQRFLNLVIDHSVTKVRKRSIILLLILLTIIAVSGFGIYYFQLY